VLRQSWGGDRERDWRVARTGSLRRREGWDQARRERKIVLLGKRVVKVWRWVVRLCGR
jgi:hypothetical protein